MHPLLVSVFNVRHTWAFAALPFSGAAVVEAAKQHRHVRCLKAVLCPDRGIKGQMGWG